MNLTAHIFRYIQQDNNNLRIWMALQSYLETLISKLFYGTKTKCIGSEGTVQGTWIYEGSELPKQKDSAWENITVYFYCHGGGYGAGNSSTGLSILIIGILMHQKILDNHKLFSTRRLVIFAIDYPLAPEKKHPAQIVFANECYDWLVNSVGCKDMILGGDSAGGNLSVVLYSELMKTPGSRILPRKLILISPWLDVSMSHMPPEIQQQRANSDLLTTQMLAKWRDNLVPSGKNARDTSISPFFELEPIKLPSEGLLIVYGSSELFAPVIENYVNHLKRKNGPNAESRLFETNQLKVIMGLGMPHNFPIVLNSLPTKGFSKANRALLEIARFITTSTE
jgi:acetyl esterase/lipase